MSRPRDLDDDIEPDDVDVWELAHAAYCYSFRLFDPPRPSPYWRPDRWDWKTPSPAEMLAIIEAHDPAAVADARRTLAREKRERR